MSSDSDHIPHRNALWIVWGALLTSVGLYGVILTVVETGSTMPTRRLELMRYILGGVGLVAGPGAYVIRKKMYFDPLENGELDDDEARVSTYFTASIIVWALCESVAIYGFALRVLGGTFADFLSFASLSVVLFVLFRPRPDEHLDAPARSATDGSGESSADETEW